MSERETQETWAPMGRQVIWVEGHDARTWLQGQVTCDIGTPRPGSATYGLIVNLQGRVELDLWVLDAGARLGLLVPSELLAATQKRLERYLIIEDADLEDDARLAVARFGGSSEVPPEWPIDWLGARGVDLVDELTPFPVDRRLDEAALRARSLERGEPRFGPDFGPGLQPGTMPQEAGLSERAVAFDKGCYVGQEPVVMLEHRGRPPRRLVRVRGAGLAEGAAVEQAERVVGTITSAVGELGFALVKRKALESGAPLVSAGSPLTLVD